MLRLWEQQTLPLPPPACRAGALLNELCSQSMVAPSSVDLDLLAYETGMHADAGAGGAREMIRTSMDLVRSQAPDPLGYTGESSSDENRTHVPGLKVRCPVRWTTEPLVTLPSIDLGSVP